MIADMKAIIDFVGRFIRIFNRKVAAFMAMAFAAVPILVCFAVYLHFEIHGLALVGLILGGVIIELLWALNVGMWWDEHFSENSRIITFPRRH